MISIRGAITVEENTKEAILEGTREMLEEILAANDLKDEDIVDIYFTATRDLTKAYPAVAARQIGLTDCSLICVQEMYVEGSLTMCIRALVHALKPCCQKDAKHVYLRKAKILRPDISS